MSSTTEIELLDFIPNWEQNFRGGHLNKEIQVWRVNIPKNIQWIENKKDLLSQEESEKFDRIIRKEDKDLFLGGKIVAKTLCASYLNCSPEEVAFAKTENQKPFIKGREDLHFNTAHSGDWVVLIFSDVPCGIDLEKIDFEFTYSEVMDISFHEAEAKFLNKSPDPRKDFYKLWTIKEAIVKAVGTGIIENLGELNALPGVKMLPANLSSKANGWHTKCFQWDDYSISICYDRSQSTVRFFEFRGMRN